MANRKSLDLIVLLVISLLIIAASAAIYFSLTMQTSVAITAPVVAFKEGSDWDAAWSQMGTNNTWCRLALKAYPNATLTYDEPLNLTNANTPVNITLRTISISPSSPDPQVSNFTFINFTLHDETGAIKGSLNYTTSGTDTWSIPSMTHTQMDANDEWYISIQTKAVAGAQANIEANIVIAVDVEE